MDEPFWYSKINIFGEKGNDGIYYDTWTDANGNTVNLLDPSVNKDALKIVLEDGIPTSSMLGSSMILGSNIYANLDGGSEGQIARDTVYLTFTQSGSSTTVYIASIKTYVDDGNQEGLLMSFTLPNDQLSIDQIHEYLPNIERAVTSVLIGQSIYIDENQNTNRTILKTRIDDALAAQGVTSWQFDDPETAVISIIAGMQNGEWHEGARISGPHMNEDTGIPTLPIADERYFYYCGTAPSPLKLTFTLTPMMRNNYISIPQNSYAQENNTNPYNIITIESVHKSELQFTTPGIYTSYNKVIYIFKNLVVGADWANIREAIRQDVHHADVRTWANRVIDSVDSNASGIIANGASELAQTYMKFMFREEKNEEVFLPGKYIFDSKTGKAIAYIQYRKVTAISAPATLNEWVDYGTIINKNTEEQKEDVGDMLKSNYLMIRDRNYPNPLTNSIGHWALDNRTASHRLYHDVANGLSNIFIEYKNLYL